MGLQTDEVEAWFRHRGLARFLEGTPLRSDISRRAVPVLVVLFILTMLSLGDGHAVLGLIGLLCVPVTWMTANLWRRRPLFAPVERVGWPESVAFVMVPTIVSAITPENPDVFLRPLILAFTDIDPVDHVIASLSRPATVIVTFLGQLTLLGIVYLLVGLGLLSLMVWLTREIWSSLANSGTALARALPLLIVVTTASYFAPGLWQSVGMLRSPMFLLLIVVFALLGLLFIAQGQKQDFAELVRFDDRAQLAEALHSTPLVDDLVTLEFPATCPLNRRQERAGRMVIAVSRLVVSTVVGTFVALFFLIVGFLTISQANVANFAAAPAEVLFGFTQGGRRICLTWQHVRMSGFMGMFAAFYFAVVSATDKVIRDKMLGAAETCVREAAAARLALLARGTDTDVTPLESST